MINIRPLIQARIATEVAGLKEIGGAADLKSLLAGRLSAPGAYVYPFTDDAGKNSLVNAVRQKNTEHFAVVMVVNNARDARGGDAADVCFEFLASINTALLGWQPDSAAEPLEKGAGRTISFIGSLYIRQVIYKTAQYLRG